MRRRLRLRPPVVLAAAAAAPVALCVATPRSRSRDVATCCLHMWAYIACYEMPHDDAQAQKEKVHIDYPVAADRAIGLGVIPTVRLQRLSDKTRISNMEKVLVWAHWLWFFAPHTALVYILLRRRERFGRAATMVYAVFDIGSSFYWVIPTAPPWYAAQEGRIGTTEPAQVRRMMVEYGEDFWGDHWQALYDFLGGNPLAAMPSLHFATTVMAAHMLSEVGPLEGAVGWTYAGTLALALVYLGEHYVIDLLAGAALTETVRRLAPLARPALARGSRAVQALEACAHS